MRFIQKHLTILVTILIGFQSFVATATNPLALPITTCFDLQKMKYEPALKYVLKKDIDCVGIEFYPIGTVELPFTGELDGQGYTISNISINSSQNDNVGIFGVTETKAKIEDLILDNINIIGHNYVGALIGTANNTVISDVIVKNKKKEHIFGNSFVGGMIGKTDKFTKIFRASAFNKVTGSKGPVGGLIGEMDGEIYNSSAHGMVIGTCAGGLIGRANGSVENSSATGLINGSGGAGGGLIGEANGKVVNSHATGNTAGRFAGGLIGIATNSVSFSSSSGRALSAGNSGSAGGLIGKTSGSVNSSFATGNAGGGFEGTAGGLIGIATGDISDSYARGNAWGGAGYAGGLIGHSEHNNIINCYSTGQVFGVNSEGNLITHGYTMSGLIGSNYLSNIFNSYWDMETSRQLTSAGGLGKSTSEMFRMNNYEGWDFFKIWFSRERISYPILRSFSK